MNKSFLTIIKETFIDSSGSGSSKRISTFFFCALIGFIAVGVQMGCMKLNETVWTDLLMLAGASLGLITAEKFNPFAKKDQAPSQPQQTPEPPAQP